MPTTKAQTPRTPSVPTLSLSVGQREALSTFLSRSIDDALQARKRQENTWQEAMRLYNGVPKWERKNFPIEDAPNFEIALAAIAADSIYAQFIDMIFSVSPVLTARGTRRTFPSDDAAKARQQQIQALQVWINYRTITTGLRDAAEHAILDDVQMGTGVYYTPWVEETRKTKTREKVLSRGPRIFAHPPEDTLVLGGKNLDLERVTFLALRFWMTKDELQEQKDWRVEEAKPQSITDQVTQQRERKGKTENQALRKEGEIYEIWLVWALRDVDGDKIREDLEVVFDRGSEKVLKERFNPYDHRPVNKMCYQIRAHLFYGIGVPEMVKSYQEETTELHNEQLLNLKLANTRMYKARFGAVQSGTIHAWTGRVLEMGEPNDLQEFAIADLYQSNPQAQGMAVSLAERRVGINDLVQPRPSQVIGSRTPGITTMSMLQMANRRFTPAFDQARLATAGAMKQALYRDQERLRMRDDALMEEMEEVLGAADADRLIILMQNDRFDNEVAVELTASSASVNKDVDRQNAIFLVNLLASYYERTLNLIAVAANPQTPPPVATAARKIAEAAGEIIDRTIRTFDSVRDPQTFILDVERELDQVEVEKGVMAQLAQLLGQVGQPTPAQEGVSDVPPAL